MGPIPRRSVLELLAAGVGGLAAWRPLQGGSEAGPPVRRRPVAFLRTNWSRDPFAQGSYSYVSRRSPGTGESDAGTLEEPVGDRLFFAGEALNPKYKSTVHAAHESGLRAAGRVRTTEAQRVAIIGAGMAGLSAAKALADAGIETAVIEARDRIGGRVVTDADTLSNPVDLGASWIHGPDGNPLTALADQLGMERVATDETYIIRGSGGRKISPIAAPGWLDGVAESTPAGVELRLLNRAYLTRVYPKHGLGYSGPDVMFPAGYSRILDALAGAYAVRLSTPVTRVALVGSGVMVSLRDDDTETFDAVIVTVPLGVLKAGTIEFDPPLSEEKLGAIDRMGMGLLDKLYLEFEDVFWDDERVIFTPENGLERGQFNYWVNLHRELKVPILMAIKGASAARTLADRTDDELVDLAMRTLDAAYPVR